MAERLRGTFLIGQVRAGQLTAGFAAATARRLVANVRLIALPAWACPGLSEANWTYLLATPRH